MLRVFLRYLIADERRRRRASPHPTPPSQPFIKVLSDTIVSEKLSSSRVERIRTEASRQFHVCFGVKTSPLGSHVATTLTAGPFSLFLLLLPRTVAITAARRRIPARAPRSSGQNKPVLAVPV